MLIIRNFPREGRLSGEHSQLVLLFRFFLIHPVKRSGGGRLQCACPAVTGVVPQGILGELRFQLAEIASDVLITEAL